MHRGLLLSSDIKSARWPWAARFPERRIQAPALSDPVWQFVPWLELARRELRQGRIPLWNPHQDAGVPLLGNAQSALLSPLVWPVLLLGADPGWNVSLLLRLLLAAASAFAFLRDLGRSRLAAGAGAAAYALSGPFVAWLEHPQTLCAAAAPLVFLYARRAARDVRPSAIAGLALSSFLVLAGGHPETQTMIALLAGAIALHAARRPSAILAPLAGGALGLALAAPALLPFFEYFRLSAAAAGEGRRGFVLPLRDLLRFVAPRLAGSNVIEAAATVSVLLLLLVPLGLAGWRRDASARFWAVAALVLLVVVYDNPLARALAGATSVYWTRALLFLALALAALGAAGLDRLRALVARPVPSAGLALFLAAAIGAELLRAAAGVHGVTPAKWLSIETPLLARLASQREPFRILPLHTMLSPNSATDYGLDDVRGYDALAPRGWRSERRNLGNFRDLPTQKDAIEPWDLAAGGAGLDFWNVRYLVAPPEFSFGAETYRIRRGLDLEEVYSGPEGRLFRNRRALPRARLSRPGDVRILRRVPGRWSLETRSEAPAILIVADAFFPGWTARVDGRSAPLSDRPGEPMRVRLAAGAHRVELAYRPASFRAGVALAALGASGVAFLLASAGARRRRGRPSG